MPRFMNERASRRSLFIDATRGLAMFFVCVSHFGIGYFGRLGQTHAEHLTSIIALPSTPTFIVLSGLLLGFLSVQSAASFPNLSLKLMDRGLFLLGPARALVMVTHFVIFRSVRFFFITDTIGICLLVGPWLVANFSSATRAALGIGLLAFSWFIYLAWTPSGPTAGVLHSILVGDVPFRFGWLTFPVLPWVGGYLLATPIGESLARWRKRGDGFVFKLGAVAALCMAAGVALHVAGRAQSPAVREILSAGQKYPPSPAFLLACGGGGLGATALMAWLEQRRLFPAVLAGFATVGRSSLVVFVVQYFVYYVVVYSLPLPATHLWPIVLAVSMAFIFAVAVWWDRRIGNEYLTVGLPYLARARAQSPAPTRP
jgi:uncharacterized membrane protein